MHSGEGFLNGRNNSMLICCISLLLLCYKLPQAFSFMQQACTISQFPCTSRVGTPDLGAIKVSSAPSFQELVVSVQAHMVLAEFSFLHL